MPKPTCAVCVKNRTIHVARVRPTFLDNANWFGPEFNPGRSGGTTGAREVVLGAGAEIMLAIEPVRPDEAFKGGAQVVFDDACVGIEFSLWAGETSDLSATCEGWAHASTRRAILADRAFYIVEITPTPRPAANSGRNLTEWSRFVEWEGQKTLRPKPLPLSGPYGDR